jgi:hypothetical protein
MKTIDQVPEMVRRPCQQCSFIGALEAVLTAHGEEYDYVDLMGLSGAAFRVRLGRSSWDEIMGGRIHPGVSIDGSFGPHADAAMEATGYEYRIVHHFPQGDTQVTETIRQEIDAGRPLLALNLCNGSAWGVICGYNDAQTPTSADGDGLAGWLLCRTCYDPPGTVAGPPPRFPADVWSISRKTSPQALDAAVRASIRRAVSLLTIDKARVNREGGWFWHYQPEYATGLAAYEAWIEDIGEEEGLASPPEDQALMYWQGNAVIYSQLLDARDAASSYLTRVAPSLPENEREPVQGAAAIFGQLVEDMVADGLFAFPQGRVRPPKWLAPARGDGGVPRQSRPALRGHMDPRDEKEDRRGAEVDPGPRQGSPQVAAAGDRLPTTGSKRRGGPRASPVTCCLLRAPTRRRRPCRSRRCSLLTPLMPTRRSTGAR